MGHNIEMTSVEGRDMQGVTLSSCELSRQNSSEIRPAAASLGCLWVVLSAVLIRLRPDVSYTGDCMTAVPRSGLMTSQLRPSHVPLVVRSASASAWFRHQLPADHLSVSLSLSLSVLQSIFPLAIYISTCNLYFHLQSVFPRPSS